MKAGHLSLCVCAVAVSSGVYSCPSSLETAQDFYQHDYGYAFKDVERISAPISVQLRLLLKSEYECKKNHESCAIDWDPWTAAQDGEIVEGPKYRKLREDGHNSYIEVRVRLHVSKETSVWRSTTVVMLKGNTDACWQIVDHDLGPRGTLTRLLTQSHK